VLNVVLGLLFLKYVSDAFETRREALQVELEKDGITGPQLELLLESRDEYTAEHVFWVPPESRWPNLRAQAVQPNIATLLDDAILAVERDNPNLKGKLPRDYARRGIPSDKLGGLINLVSEIGFKGERAKARDTLGRVYEYFLGKFAAAEGKLGGEFYTPRGVVRLLVEMLEPYNGRVYDPCCGSGGIVVLSAKKPAGATWLLMLVSSDEFVSHANQTSAGTKMPRANWKDMASFPVALPPDDLLRSFQQAVAPMLDLIRHGIHESRKFAALRDYLLPKLLSGELRVAEEAKTEDCRT